MRHALACLTAVGHNERAVNMERFRPSFLMPFQLWVEIKASRQHGMTVKPTGRTIGNQLSAIRPVSPLL